MIECPLAWHTPVWNQLYQLAQSNKLPHALLLSGPSGTGKSQFGQAFAQLLLCEKPQWLDHNQCYTACNQCQSCHWFQAQTHPNCYTVKPAGESNTPKIVIEQIRDLTESLQKTAKKKAHNATHYYTSIAVIHAAEYLNTAASNALLKTLEEPLPGILFILIVDQPQNLLVTIQSRCHRIMLPTPSPQIGFDWLSHQLSRNHQPINLSHIETTLKLADYLPLKAFELIQNPKIIECYTQLFHSLLQLQSGAVNPTQVAQIWSTHSIELVFNYLYQSIYTLVQLKLGLLSTTKGSLLTPEGIATIVENIDLKTLFHWLDIIQKTKQEMKQYSLNALLVLENIACQFASSD